MTGSCAAPGSRPSSTSTTTPGRTPRSPSALPRGPLRRFERLGISVRSATRDSLEEDARLVGRMFNRIWSGNWGFEPLTEPEILARARQLRHVLRPDWLAIAEREGSPVGMAVALPDLNRIHARHRTGALVPNLLHLAFAARRLTRIRVPLLGVVPELRNKGAEVALLHVMWRNCRRDGVDWAEAGWVLDDNAPMNNLMQRVGFERYKTLRMYRLDA